MKNIIFIILLSSTFIWAQNGTSTYAGEIFIATRIVPNNKEVKFYAESINNVRWHPKYLTLTNDYLIDSLIIIGNQNDCSKNAFDLNGDATTQYPQLGKSVYKI